MRRIGAVTIGESPRIDVIPELKHYLPSDVEIIQAGVLDGLSSDEICNLEPSSETDGPILVSRLCCGNWVKMAENKILPLVQDRINQLVMQNVQLIVMLCTGHFPEDFDCTVPIIFPQKVLYGVVSAIANKVGIVSPDSSQVNETRKRWTEILPDVIVGSSNPYSGAKEIEKLGHLFAENNVELCVLDCIGYDLNMKKRMELASGLPVVLPRTLVARIVSEILVDDDCNQAYRK